MSRGPHTFKQCDVTRAIKAVRAAGVQNPVVEITGGTVRVFGSDKSVLPLATAKPDTTWDDDAAQTTAVR